ncbi:polymorphic toxin type 44 domain-containing protein [Microbulbifer sp. MLAF003]|uniref:polymorphic toxin type 44 domain-containing protein n=1 Tax=unclassified Microbulbifer TaxID=2619833 RepID=UPI0024AD7566|nr:polymorphic toxin type 44 domain-containing protein [Microbulbifer sp. MLAF003]WHI52754.1 polymorphic toxin type 44 domain-containing protein [Microbulbifer sp. MLAF003]
MYLSRFISGLLLIGGLAGSKAFASDSMDCVVIEKNDLVQVELNKSNSYQNCFSLDKIPSSTPVDIVSFAFDDTKNKLSVYEVGSSNTKQLVVNSISGTDTVNAISLNTHNKSLIVEIAPTIKLTSNKDVDITYLMVNGRAQVIVKIYDVKSQTSSGGSSGGGTTIPPIDPGGCDSVMCREPVFFMATSSSAQACTASQKAPNPPSNFDINKHLKQFKRAGIAASKLPGGKVTLSAAVMASMFAPNRTYDLKNNPNYNADQEFGNWFYGAAAHQMGFTEQEALTAGAVVQQWQNYNNSNHPDANDIGKLVGNIAHALATGEGDNHDDAAPIKGGHSYSKDIYENDANADSNSDSCSPNKTVNSPTTAAPGYGIGGLGYGGGWSGGGMYFGSGGCWGSCSRTVIIVESL